MLVLGALAGPQAAGATLEPPVTAYSAALSPATVPAGASVTTTLRITNESSPALRVLGWVRVTVPSGFTVTGLGSPATFKASGASSTKRWAATPTADGFVLKPTKVLDVLTGKESVTIAITGTAPCVAGALEFGTAASVAQLGWALGDRWPLQGPRPTLEVTGSCTKLAIVSANGGNDPVVGAPFDVVVQLQTLAGSPASAAQDIPVTLAVTSGTGALGTTAGTILAGQSQTTISTSYNTVENGVSITATGPPGTSPPVSFDVLAVQVTGPATVANPLLTCSDTTPADPVCARAFVQGTSSTFTLSEQSCVLNGSSVCRASLVGFFGEFGAGVATIRIEYDKTIAPPLTAFPLIFELVEGGGFVEAPNCVRGSVDRASVAARVSTGPTIPVVNPKPVCVSKRFKDAQGDAVIEA